jgi:hypothetical protein
MSRHPAYVAELIFERLSRRNRYFARTQRDRGVGGMNKGRYFKDSWVDGLFAWRQTCCDTLKLL